MNPRLLVLLVSVALACTPAASHPVAGESPAAAAE